MSIMVLADPQKAVISNIFRDLTKLTVVALVLGQFVPGQEFDLRVLIGGLISAIFFGVTAVISAGSNKGGDE